MSTFGDDLIRSRSAAVAPAKEGSVVVGAPLAPREVQERTHLTQAQMAPPMGMTVSGYRKWEGDARHQRTR